MKRLNALFLSMALACLPAFGQAANQVHKPDVFTSHMHAPLVAVPSSPADVLLATNGAAGVTILSGWFVNTNNSTVVTVTVTCKTGSNVLIEAAIPGVTAGGNNIAIQLPVDGVYCAGGASWVASGSGVNGTLSEKH